MVSRNQDRNIFLSPQVLSDEEFNTRTKKIERIAVETQVIILLYVY